MKAVAEKRFFFHANAVALAAHIRRPDDFYIPAIASSCLPVTGGTGKAEVEKASYGDVLSYEAASTTVFGDFTDDRRAVDFTHGNSGENDLPTLSFAESQVAGLEIRNGGRLLRVDRLSTKMSSSSDQLGVTRFHALTADFENVRVDGVSLRVTTHCDIFTTYDTKLALGQAYEDDDEFRGNYGSCFFGVRGGDFGDDILGGLLPESNGLIYGTIVSGLNWEGDAPEGTEISGNRLTITGFGSLYFGEILIEEGFRRLTLLRFELGSPTGGNGSAAEVQTNGSTWPPRR